MTDLAWISQYKSLAQDAQGRPVLAPLEPALVTESIDFNGGATLSSVFLSETRFIALTCDTVCHFEAGKTPVAAITTAFRLVAGAERIMGVDGFHGHRLSVIEGA